MFTVHVHDPADEEAALRVFAAADVLYTRKGGVLDLIVKDISPAPQPSTPERQLALAAYFEHDAAALYALVDDFLAARAAPEGFESREAMKQRLASLEAFSKAQGEEIEEYRRQVKDLSRALDRYL